jgi:hypothetical protein
MRRLPAMSLTTKGGAVFPVTWPIIPVLASTNGGPYHPIGYCLGVIKNSIFSTEDATIGRTLFSLSSYILSHCKYKYIQLVVLFHVFLLSFLIAKTEKL